MDSARLTAVMENTYIPSDKKSKSDAVPAHHPSLIMLDKQTDTTHHLKCGCCGGACISENAWWEKKKGSQKSQDEQDRPAYRRGSSSSSISTVSSYSSSSC